VHTTTITPTQTAVTSTTTLKDLRSTVTETRSTTSVYTELATGDTAWETVTVSNEEGGAWTMTTIITTTQTPTTTVTDVPVTLTNTVYDQVTDTVHPIGYVAVETGCPTTTTTTPSAEIPTTTAPLLANTGSNSAPALVLGLLFILGGSAILALVYRRQPSSHRGSTRR
jgi:hypothetical protein